MRVTIEKTTNGFIVATTKGYKRTKDVFATYDQVREFVNDFFASGKPVEKKSEEPVLEETASEEGSSETPSE